MAYGAGHALDMIKRMAQNRSLRPSNRSKFKENNRDGIYSEPNKYTEKPEWKKIPEEELIKVKEQIRLKAEKEKKKQRILMTVFVVTFILILIGFLILMN
ncbi:hypothetical protein MG296_14240 [Flavobacteriaceae bacterium TK19130]|nr:hypothetical protein [Thermobacterium salinum]